jgi:lipopolysaccharide biosynthesis protein
MISRVSLIRLLKRLQLVLFLPFWIVGHLCRLGSWVRQRWPGEDPMARSRHEAVYAHYDRRGVVHDYVIQQLRELVEAGFRVTFVSNSPVFPPASVRAAGTHCKQILWRRNMGHDFGAYKDGIRSLGDLKNVDRLLLMNDSVYGPFCPLSELLQRFDPSRIDLWGITDSWEGHYHVQSYFVLFLKGAIDLPAFRRFWRRLPYFNLKTWVIRGGEIKLTQILARSKLRTAVLYPYWDTAKLALQRLQHATPDLPPSHQKFLDELHSRVILGIPLNQMHYFCETLLTELDCPFIKRDLIAANPVKVPFSWRWPELIEQRSTYDRGLIYRHLQAN